MLLEKINLNLLRTLHVLLQTRHITVASQKLFVSQPAVSASLKQLRTIFNDPLLIKTNEKLLTLTDQAKYIQPKLERWLDDGKNLLTVNQSVDLSTKRTFWIGIQNHVNSLILSHLYVFLKKQAPNARIRTVALTDLSEISHNALNQFDFIIGSFTIPLKGFRREHYFSDKLACLSGVLALNKKWKKGAKNIISKKELNQHEHIIYSCTNDYTESIIEVDLNSNGVHRQFQMIISDIQSVKMIVEKNHLLTVLPKKSGELYTPSSKLALFDLPFVSREIRVDIFYKESQKKVGEIEWLFSVLRGFNF